MEVPLTLGDRLLQIEKFLTSKLLMVIFILVIFMIEVKIFQVWIKKKLKDHLSKSLMTFYFSSQELLALQRSQRPSNPDSMEIKNFFLNHTFYNPLDYASESHENFVRKWLSTGPRKVLFLGMNPGRHGMISSNSGIFPRLII